LADRHSKVLLERACKHAVERGDLSFKTIRTLLKLCLSGMLLEDGDDASINQSKPRPRFARSVDELVPVSADTDAAAEWLAVSIECPLS